MRGRCGTRQRVLVLGLAAVTLISGAVFAAPGAADPRLERAQEQHQERQAELDRLLERIDGLEAEIDDRETELERLRSRIARFRESTDEAASRVVQQVRAAYKHGRPDPVWTLLTADDVGTATERSRLLRVLAARHQVDAEHAHASRLQATATAEHITTVLGEVEERTAALQAAKDEAETLLAEAESQVAAVRETIRKEEAEAERRRRATQRQRAVAASRSSASAASSGGTSASGGIACPVGHPRSFSDTYGQPRSGGRGHKGTDILAPRGTHLYAYEAGTITRMHTNRLGGIVLYLRGDSGNTYYYAHLQGYVAGLSTGQRVRAGQHIGFNGDTGNARGIPHLHIEVMPGGSGNVNPYPYMRRACG
jgi:peptidoglycan LD-endopeptidase LytH